MTGHTPSQQTTDGLRQAEVQSMDIWQAYAAAQDEISALKRERAAVIEELALDFENSVHHVWDNQEVADRIRALSQAPVTDGVQSPETFEKWLTRTAAHALSLAAESRSISPDSWGSGFDTGYSDALEHAKAHFKAVSHD
jgi:hypothetical protein